MNPQITQINADGLKETKEKGLSLICENLRHLRISYLMRVKISPFGRNDNEPSCAGISYMIMPDENPLKSP